MAHCKSTRGHTITLDCISNEQLHNRTVCRWTKGDAIKSPFNLIELGAYINKKSCKMLSRPRQASPLSNLNRERV